MLCVGIVAVVVVLVIVVVVNVVVVVVVVRCVFGGGWPVRLSRMRPCTAGIEAVRRSSRTELCDPNFGFLQSFCFCGPHNHQGFSIVFHVSADFGPSGPRAPHVSV